MTAKGDSGELLAPFQVAEIFRVQVTQVNRWAKDGKLHPIKTPGGTSRFFRAEVEAWVRGEPLTAEELDALREQYINGAIS